MAGCEVILSRVCARGIGPQAPPQRGHGHLAVWCSRRPGNRDLML